jgi:hypothetical protein
MPDENQYSLVHKARKASGQAKDVAPPPGVVRPKVLGTYRNGEDDGKISPAVKKDRSVIDSGDDSHLGERIFQI